MVSPLTDRRSSISSIGARSIESTPRLSIDKRHSPDRRLSTDSSIRTPLPNLPGVASLPGLSSNSPLVAGGSMPPPTSPKDRLPPPMTPTRKPVMRQKSPLSSEAFSSTSHTTPSSTMPGAFPNTPSPAPQLSLNVGDFRATAYSSTSQTPDSNSANAKRNAGKRASSFRNFLPFKALRRSYGNSSPDSSPKSNGARPSTSMSFRPTTPGADSMISGEQKPRLRHKLSGTFWKRKSSGGTIGFGSGDSDASTVEHTTSTNGNGSAHTTSPDSPRANGYGTNTTNNRGILHKEEGEGANARPGTPVLEDDSSVLPKTRKSGTFWRRKSSLSLATALDGEKTEWGTGSRKPSVEVNGQGTASDVNGHGIIRTGSEEGESFGNTMEVPIVLRKSPTPPPQLPPFIGGGGGFGDLFKNIN